MENFIGFSPSGRTGLVVGPHPTGTGVTCQPPRKYGAHLRIAIFPSPGWIVAKLGVLTDEPTRIADLVELHACAPLHGPHEPVRAGPWLEVFTPDAEYNAFGTPYTLERFPALLEAAPRGQFIGNMPVVELDGDTRHRHAALRVHRPADARHAARLVQRRVRAHRRRLAHPPAVDHVHAQARRLRLRRQHDPLAETTEGARPMTELPKIISVDDHVVEPAHVWQDRLPAKYARAGPARRAEALGRLRARRRRVRTSRR